MIFETNLPGNSIQVIDEYNISSFDSSQFGTTESVLVIGTAFDGPTGKEVAIYNPEHAAYIFGNSYDHRTRKNATLVPYIQDVYAQGCRTIYAMRVGGKELCSTYKLKQNCAIFLKISALFPSNKYKDMCLSINEGMLTIYKTANKATIVEKRDGVVESSESIISFGININDPYGINETTKLVDMIQTVNANPKNNVFTLSLVNAEGIEITNLQETQFLTVGSLFDGVYTIGRKSLPLDLASPLTEVSAIVSENNDVEFVLTSNNILENKYPYYKSGYNYDSLKTFGVLDRISIKDSIDYEEVDMSNFELYKKLGSGYAQTAMAYKKEGSETIIVRPTPQDSPLFSVEIAEGIYSTISNLKTDYRVLSCAYADTKIQGALPKKEDFTNVSIKKIPALFANNIAGEPVEAAYATYKLEDDVESYFKFVTKKVASPKPIIVDFKTSFKGKIISVDTIKDFAPDVTSGEKYALVEFANTYWIVGPDKKVLTPLNKLNEEAPIFNISFEKLLTGNKPYIINIDIDDEFTEWTLVSQFVEEFNQSELGNMFAFTASPKYVNELIVDSPAIVEPVKNKEISPDLSVVIPYTTSDNFARQLAQHSEYTSLKTYQTHGVIGMTPIVNTSLKSVAEQVNRIVELDYDLYVKNNVGRLVLDVNNLPYHIGKSISIVAEQHSISTSDGLKMMASGAGAYVGRASIISKDTSTTNQFIALEPHFEYSETQKVALNKKGYVTVSFKDGLYKITDGVTQAPQYSQFSRFATFRTMKLVDKVIRDAIDPFIGKKNDMANRNTMYTAIKSGMDALIGTYLEKYEFKIDYNKFAARLGEISIDYTIDIVNEIRNVKNRVTAKSE